MVTRTATDVHLTDAPARTIVSRLASTSQAGLRDVIGPSLADLYGAAGQGGAQPAGPPMVIYHAYTEDHAWSIEVCLPIAHQIDTPPGFSCRQLPCEPDLPEHARHAARPDTHDHRAPDHPARSTPPLTIYGVRPAIGANHALTLLVTLSSPTSC